MARMRDDEILSITEARVRDAVGYTYSTINKQREMALRYYRGDPFGNEIAGRSQVVSRDVAQYTDTFMPSLMRIFSSGDQVVRFEPSEPEDEEATKQATDYVNWIWSQQNDGFLNFHHWFKDGLLAKIGVVKIWWDDSPTQTQERYQGLNAEELAAIQADKDIEVGEVTEGAVEMAGPDGLPMMMPVYDVAVVKTNREGQVRVAGVPPEDFFFGQRARSDRNANGVLGHRDYKTRSELVEMGYDRDVVAKLFAGDDRDNDSEVVARFEDVSTSPLYNIEESDPGPSGTVEVIEAYIRLDVNDDGVAEYLKVCYSGGHLLDWEEVDDHPFAVVTPIPMPHRLAGLSMADQLMDIQMINSTIQRQILDNLYLHNMPQTEVVEGEVNMQDVLNRRPGGVVRVKRLGAMTIHQTPALGAEPFNFLEYMAGVAEQRTGATRYNQGLDANTLNKTATGINLIQNAAAQRIELVARVYAETGVKRAFRRILSLVSKHQRKARMIRLRNRWVPMDPRGWKTSWDMTVTVGVGNGNKDQTLAHMMTLLQTTMAIVDKQGGVSGPLVTGSNVFNQLAKLCEGMGLKDVEQYFTDPAAQDGQPQEQQPPPPDPKVMEAQAKMQSQQQTAQAQMELDRQKAEHDAMLAEQKMQHEMRLAQQRAALEREVALIKAETEREVAIYKARAEAERADAASDRAETRADVGMMTAGEKQDD